MKKAHAFNKEHAGYPVSNDCKPDDISKTYAMPPQNNKPLFDVCRWLGLQLRQGFETLQNTVTMTVNHGFFVPCPKFSMGRGGISAIKHPYGKGLCAVLFWRFRTPRLPFLVVDIRRSKTGGHNHA